MYSGIFYIYIQLDYFPTSLGIPRISNLEILSISMNYFSFITKSLPRNYTPLKSTAGK